jgi:Secretion system C-terminal sorting domain/Ig-like domain CHU_C associated
MAAGTGTVNWYTSFSSTTIVNSGLSFTVTPTSVGTFSYYASTTSSCGAESNRTAFVVTINPVPTISVNSGTICSGNSFTIIPNGAVNYTFQGGNAVVNPFVTSSYTVVGANIFGCISPSFATSQVTVKASPTINVVSNNPVICIGGTANLSATGGIAFFWTPGGSGSSISVSPSITTTYSVNGLGSNGCSGSTLFTQNVSLCDGINQISNSGKALSVFPNPSSAYITIKTEEAIQSVFIFNAQGALMKTETQSTFLVEHLSKGIYFLQIKTERGVSVSRFVKE